MYTSSQRKMEAAMINVKNTIYLDNNTLIYIVEHGNDAINAKVSEIVESESSSFIVL